MIHFLRDSKNNSIVDVSATKDDISSVVCIDHYSTFLLNAPEEDRPEIIADFNRIQEIRGEYWEMAKDMLNENPDQTAERVIKEVGKKWDLAYVTD